MRRNGYTVPDMNRTLLIRSIAAFVIGTGVWFAWSQPGRQPLTIEKVTPNLYVIIGNGGNVAVLPTAEGVILVDDKFEVDYANIMAEVKKFTSQPVKYVINTHHHGDHSGSNAKMQALGAQIVASEAAWQNMVDLKQPGLPTVTIEHEARNHVCRHRR